MARQIVVSLFESTGSVWLFDPVGETFTESVVGTASTWHHLAYAPRSKTFVAAGAGGLIATSEDDGGTWDVDDLGTGDVGSVMWDGEQFVALSSNKVFTATAQPSSSGWTEVGDNTGGGANTALGARDVIKRSSTYYSGSLRYGLSGAATQMHTGAIMRAPTNFTPAGTWTQIAVPFTGGGLELNITQYASSSSTSRVAVDRTIVTDGDITVGLACRPGNRVQWNANPTTAAWVNAVFLGTSIEFVSAVKGDGYWVGCGMFNDAGVRKLAWSYGVDGKTWENVTEASEGSWALTSAFYDSEEDVFWFAAAPTVAPFTKAALFKMTPGADPPADRTWERFDLPAGATSGGWAVAGVNDVVGPLRVAFFAYPVVTPTPPPPPVPDPAGQSEMWFGATGTQPSPPTPSVSDHLVGSIGGVEA